MQTGAYRFETVKPGRVPFVDGRIQAPHVSFWIVARGINLGLNTRMYFADEAGANGEDPVLGMIEHRVRVPTLIAASCWRKWPLMAPSDIRRQRAAASIPDIPSKPLGFSSKRWK